jgi:ABC-2 type transport system permease protein
VFVDDQIPQSLQNVARIVPSGALGEALNRGVASSFDLFGVAVLLVWAAVCGTLAVRTFKFT